jgi:hypothetical protein
VAPASSNEVELQVGLGQFSEDVDNDGVALEGELDSSKDGFLFNDALSGNGNTRVGGGSHIVMRIGAEIKPQASDGVLQSEDMDRNLRLDTPTGTSNLFLPAPNYAPVFAGNAADAPSSDRLYVKADGQWKLIRISIDKAQMTTEEQDLLKRGIKNVVLIVKQVNGKQGKLLLEEMRFVGPSYSDLRVNASVDSTNVNEHMNVTYVTKKGDTNYEVFNLRDFTESDAFADSPDFEKEPSYQDLHGFVLDSEWQAMDEQAFELDYYRLRNHDFTLRPEEQTNTMVLAGRYFTTAADMRFYKMLKIWAKVVRPMGNEWFFYRFGSSPNDYWEYRIPVSEMTNNAWALVKIDLEKAAELTNRWYANPSDPDDRYRMEGRPALRSFAYAAYGVYAASVSASSNTNGRLWINDTFLDKPKVQTGYGYAWSGSLALRKHLKLGYSYSRIDKVFSRVGGAGTGVESRSRNIDAAWSSLGWLPVGVSWNRSEQISDPDDITVPYYEKGRYVNNVWNFNGGLKLSAWTGIFKKFSKNVPDFTASYRVSSSSNSQPLNFSREYFLYQRVQSEGLLISGSWTVPTPTNWRFSLKAGADYSRTRDAQHSYTYRVGGSATNLVAIPYSLQETFSLRLPFVWNKVSISPVFAYQLASAGTGAEYFLDSSPLMRTWQPGVASNLISSRSRSLTLPLTFGKVWVMNPAFNYGVTYQESGFYYSPPASGNSNSLVRHPSFQLNLGGGYGSFTFKKFPLQSLAPDYKRTFTVGNQFVRDDAHGGMDYFWDTLGTFGTVLIPFPYQFFAIPWLGYFPNMNLVKGYMDYPNASVVLTESLSLRLGLDVLKLLTGTVSYSYNQTTSRSRNNWSYQFKADHSLQYGSSVNIMEQLAKLKKKKAAEERPDPRKAADPKAKKKYQKSASLSYSLRYTFSQDFITSLRRWTLSPSASLNYQWTAEMSCSLSSDFSFARDNLFKPDPYFKEFLKTGMPEQYAIMKWDDEPPPGGSRVYNVRDTSSLGLQFSLRFPSSLPEKWKVPIFKKEIKLDTRINHVTSLEFRNNFITSKEDRSFRNVNTVAHVALTHSVTYDISANVDGDMYLKFSYDQTRTTGGGLSDAESKASTEYFGSLEMGLKLRIKF